MDWSWTTLGEILPDLLRGAVWTVVYTVVAFPLALLLGLILAIAQSVGATPGRWAVTACAAFVRGTPLLVQIYALYFFLPELGIRLPAYTVGAAALAMHYGCYICEVYLAGFRSVSAGQWKRRARSA